MRDSEIDEGDLLNASGLIMEKVRNLFEFDSVRRPLHFSGCFNGLKP